MSDFDVLSLTPAQLQAAVDRQKRELASQRDAARGALTTIAKTLAPGALPGVGPSTKFASGAEGWSLGGSKLVVTLPDGSTREARVSLLVRWEDTIPAKEKKA